MDSPKVNLSSLINSNQKKIRDKDDYILEMTNISKENLEKIDDEKYNKILEKIEEVLKQRNEEKNEIEIENENWELFLNYKSDFKSEEKSLFSNLRKKRIQIQEKLRMPKTRIWLVISLLILTISIISGLFIFSPEHNSYSIYKANILEIMAKYKGENKITKEVIKIEDFFFDIEIEETKKWNIYKYDSKIFNTKSELNNYLNKQVKIKKEKLNTLTWEKLKKYKEEIIRDALNHKYKN